MTKKQFLQDEIWMLSTFGAFQRANIYKPNVSEVQRVNFKIVLREFIDENLLEQYDSNVSELEHVQNINALMKYSALFKDILNNESLNFGVCQKLFNLYLKYLWCLEEIPTPPHFPVDRIIQEKLGIKNIEPWTQFQHAEPYINVINIAKAKIKDSNFESLAQMELQLFNR